MACNHKFSDYLMLQGLDFQPEVLIVGTFNPSFPQGNDAEWFYGRAENNFWEVLPRLYGEESLRNQTPHAWKCFCIRHKIAITDIITSIDDADEGNPEHLEWLGNFSDKNIATKFNEHTPTQVNLILLQNPSIRNVYFTRGVGETFWSTAWQPISDYALLNEINPQTLMTPSNYARFQQGKHNRAHPENLLSIPDYILMRWQEVWHEISSNPVRELL